MAAESYTKASRARPNPIRVGADATHCARFSSDRSDPGLRNADGASGEVSFGAMAGSPPNGSSGAEDDDLEIQVEGRPAPQPQPQPQPQPRKRPRTPNPVADEVIHTGEIGASRSLIIRSSPSIPVE